MSRNQLYRISWTFNHAENLNFTPEAFAAFAPTIKSNLETKLPGSKFIFSLERCPTTGRLHYQGHINLKSKLRVIEFAGKVRDFMPGVHASPDSERGSTNAEFYCFDPTKPSFVAGPYADRDYIVPDHSWVEQPRGWQLFVKGIMTAPPVQRLIYWFWEPKGNVGKSNFTTYMELNCKVIGLGLGTARDNYYAVSEMTARGYVFDVPRTPPKDFDWKDVYASLEKIKDCNFLSTKYKPKKVILPVIPHMVIFANIPPHYHMMSLDRWRVYRIVVNANQNDCVLEYPVA